ncbi:MAG TPA: DNA primase [Chroococcales cyanobacterium]|jgi:DNA primase
MNDSEIQQVREKADILEVIGEYVVLRRSGRNHLGLCPFHGEKTPSFNVNPQRGIFRCFGCGAGGDVFAFLMRMNGQSFPEVLRTLAERYGVRLEARSERDFDERKVLREANELAMDFFKENLLHPERGRSARAYLEARDIGVEAWEKFDLGFAPSGWSSLHDFLIARKISGELQEAAGLAISRPSGGHYDRFRDRLIFPILSDMGHPLGFGGRVLGNEEPKYMNSPETTLYQKGKILYGLHQAKKVIKAKGRALLTEGYLDVISCHLHGFEEAVGVLGTALTPIQARSLLRYAQRVVVSYDSDRAGVMAAERGSATLEEVSRGVGIEVSILRIPDGKDPDGFLRNHGAERFGTLIEEAQSLSLFQVEAAIGTEERESPEAKARAVERALAVIRRIPSPVEQDERIRLLAERLGIREESVRLEIRRNFRHNSKPSGRTGPVKDRAERAEEGLLHLMVEHPPTRKLVATRLAGIPFSEGTRQALRERIEANDPGEGESTKGYWERLLKETIEQEAHTLVSALLFNEEPQGWTDFDQMGLAFIATVELRHWEERKAELGQALKNAVGEERTELGRRFQQAATRSLELNGIIQGLSDCLPEDALC